MRPPAIQENHFAFRGPLGSRKRRDWPEGCYGSSGMRQWSFSPGGKYRALMSLWIFLETGESAEGTHVEY